jgi:transposase
MRQKRLKPVMDEFFEWLTTFPVVMGKLKKAVNYALNQKVSLMRVLEDGRLQLSNNRAEQKIKPLVIGRKNHLFSTSERGATANAIAYTIIETAKENGLDGYKYLEYLFSRLPNLDFHRHSELLEDLLPWASEPQQRCLASTSTNDTISIAS